MSIDQPFLTPVLIRGRELYQVQRRYPFPCYGSEEEAPEGLIVDGASNPRVAWWFLPPDGLHRAGALGHDCNYKRKGLLANGRRITRTQADILFYHMMLQGGVPRWRALIVYRMVRRFGEPPWRDPKNVLKVLPLIQQAPTMHRKPPIAIVRPFMRHIYATP